MQQRVLISKKTTFLIFPHEAVYMQVSNRKRHKAGKEKKITFGTSFSNAFLFIYQNKTKKVCSFRTENKDHIYLSPTNKFSILLSDCVDADKCVSKLGEMTVALTQR